jgi:hypothetical protein
LSTPNFIKNALRGERAFFNKEVVMFFINKDEKKSERFRYICENFLDFLFSSNNQLFLYFPFFGTLKIKYQNGKLQIKIQKQQKTIPP